MQIILLMAQASGDFPDIPGVQGGKKKQNLEENLIL